MNYGEIKKYDVANGPGIRLTLFVSGCSHHCKGCFNEDTWDFSYGEEFTDKQIEEIIEELKFPGYKGFTILGGEPLEHVNQKGLLPLLRRVKKEYPNLNIWCYTGYIYEKDVMGYMANEWEETKELLSYIDVLVDGPFILEQRNISLMFRGSENQRLIDLRKTEQEGKVVLWERKE